MLCCDLMWQLSYLNLPLECPKDAISTDTCVRSPCLPSTFGDVVWNSVPRGQCFVVTPHCASLSERWKLRLATAWGNHNVCWESNITLIVLHYRYYWQTSPSTLVALRSPSSSALVMWTHGCRLSPPPRPSALDSSFQLGTAYHTHVHYSVRSI